MTKISGWIKGVVVPLLGLVALVIVALVYIGIPQNAAGMAAKGVCSARFVAGRPAANLLAEDVLPASAVLSLIQVEVDEANRAVRARFAGLFQRTAVLLPNRGCVLDVATGNTTASSVSKIQSAQTAWPQGDLPLAQADWGAGVDAAALQKVIDAAFVGAGNPLAANARGLAIVHKGRLLALKTAPGFAAQTPLHGWSMTKTVTGMLMHKLGNDTQLPMNSLVVNAFAEVGTHRSTLTEWLRVARAQGWKALLKRQPKGKGAGGSGCMVPFVTRRRALGQGAGHSATWKVTRESLAAFHHRRSRTKEKVSLRE